MSTHELTLPPCIQPSEEVLLLAISSNFPKYTGITAVTRFIFFSSYKYNNNSNQNECM